MEGSKSPASEALVNTKVHTSGGGKLGEWDAMGDYFLWQDIAPTPRLGMFYFIEEAVRKQCERKYRGSLEVKVIR